MTDNYSEHQTTYPGSLEYKQGKCRRTAPRQVTFKLQKIKDKEKNPERKEDGEVHTYHRDIITIII